MIEDVRMKQTLPRGKPCGHARKCVLFVARNIDLPSSVRCQKDRIYQPLEVIVIASAARCYERI